MILWRVTYILHVVVWALAHAGEKANLHFTCVVHLTLMDLCKYDVQGQSTQEHQRHRHYCCHRQSTHKGMPHKNLPTYSMILTKSGMYFKNPNTDVGMTHHWHCRVQQKENWACVNTQGQCSLFTHAGPNEGNGIARAWCLFVMPMSWGCNSNICPFCCAGRCVCGRLIFGLLRGHGREDGQHKCGIESTVYPSPSLHVKSLAAVRARWPSGGFDVVICVADGQTRWFG